MPQAACLVSRRTAAWLCIFSNALLCVCLETRADEPIEIFELPPLSSETEVSKSYDVESPARPGKRSVAETEFDAAKKHVRNQPLNRVKASIKPPVGDLPHQHSVDDLVVPEGLFLADQSRPWAFSCYEWEAPATRNLPLLFEEPNLERLGYAYGICDIGICDEGPRRGQRLQTLVSGFNFFARIPFIPYMAGVHPLTEPVYTLGTDRPGSPVPYRKYLPHCSLRGAAYQAGAIVGAVFIIP